eukprot:761254-Hanusia_phi.AAC.1
MEGTDRRDLDFQFLLLHRTSPPCPKTDLEIIVSRHRTVNPTHPPQRSSEQIGTRTHPGGPRPGPSRSAGRPARYRR